MTDKRKTQRREKIVSEARKAFTADGYDGTSIGDLAGGLGISKAAIAYYFPTKDTFLDEFIAPFLDELQEAVESVDAQSVVSDYLSTLTRHQDIAVWIDTDQVLQSHPIYGERLAAINQVAIGGITKKSRKRADQIRALGVLGGLWRPVRELSTADLAAHHDDIVAAALAGY